LHKEIELLKTNLKSLNRKVEEVEKSQEFMSKKYHSILTTISEVKKASLGLEQQAKEMEGKVDKLNDNGYNLELPLDELEHMVEEIALRSLAYQRQ
jgi:predicted nuclease with TOPRIM domain